MTRTSRGWRPPGSGRTRFELGWKSLEPSQGSFRWARSDQFIGATCLARNPAVPVRVEVPAVGGRQPREAPARQRRRTSRRGATSSRRRWRATDRAAATGPPLPPAIRRGRHAAADPVLADLERAQPEEVLRPRGTSDQQSAWKYARLLRISHDAIKNRDPNARIVLAGNPGYPPSGGLKAWDFLDTLYGVPGIKDDFDAAALHPYSSTSTGSASSSSYSAG